VKEIFDIFINRTTAYHYSHHIGLVTFNSTATVSQEITHVIEDLRGKVMLIEAFGGTAIWKALELAAECLTKYAARYPRAKKRILALSDGEDESFTFTERETCLRLQVIVVCHILICRGQTSWSTVLQLVTGAIRRSKRYPMRAPSIYIGTDLEPEAISFGPEVSIAL
jgi:hypothetical protein